MKRRALFQPVLRDLRRAARPAMATPPDARPGVAGDGASWRGQLQGLLADARAAQYFDRACAVCDELGVAYIEEVVQNAAEVADKLGMKRLERARFLARAAAA